MSSLLMSKGWSANSFGVSSAGLPEAQILACELILSENRCLLGNYVAPPGLVEAIAATQIGAHLDLAGEGTRPGDSLAYVFFCLVFGIFHLALTE